MPSLSRLCAGMNVVLSLSQKDVESEYQTGDNVSRQEDGCRIEADVSTTGPMVAHFVEWEITILSVFQYQGYDCPKNIAISKSEEQVPLSA